MSREKKRPLMIALGGMSGSGKSTVGHALGHILEGAVFLDSDVLRKEMFGVSPTTPLPDHAYTPEATAKFIEYARARAAAKMRSHDIVIITGIFIDGKTPAEQAKFAEENGADFIGLYLHAPLSTLFARVSERDGTASDADRAVLKRQAKNFLQNEVRGVRWAMINSDQPMEKVINEALKTIQGAYQKIKPPAAPSSDKKPGPKTS